MIALALGLMFQANTATVGDTLWITRSVAVAAHQTVRPTEWTPSDPVEALGPPEVLARNGRVELRYPLTVWRAGSRRLEIPGPLLLGANGRIDSLPPHIVSLEIASVLPDAPADSAIPPQPSAAIVHRSVTSPWPLVVLLVATTLFLVPLGWWWRRRGQAAPWPSPRESVPPPVPLDRWAEAGEWRVVASVAAVRLRAVAAERRGRDAAGDVVAADSTGLRAESPALDSELDDVLGRLDLARFGTEADADVPGLVQRAAELERRLAGPSA